MEIERAARTIREGGLVVYPTETVYGLGADALDPSAVKRVFEAKCRPHGKSLSMAVPDIETASEYISLTTREQAFIETFLPGPVTVLVKAGPEIPDELIAGGDRVGIRIPDHDLARSLLREVAPITATSANRSGNPSVRRPSELDPEIREVVGYIIEDGELPGTESTVFDVEHEKIHRRGALADEIEAWLS